MFLESIIMRRPPQLVFPEGQFVRQRGNNYLFLISDVTRLTVQINDEETHPLRQNPPHTHAQQRANVCVRSAIPRQAHVEHALTGGERSCGNITVWWRTGGRGAHVWLLHHPTNPSQRGHPTPAQPPLSSNHSGAIAVHGRGGLWWRGGGRSQRQRQPREQGQPQRSWLAGSRW